jgi:hypothetical protein
MDFWRLSGQTLTLTSDLDRMKPNAVSRLMSVGSPEDVKTKCYSFPKWLVDRWTKNSNARHHPCNFRAPSLHSSTQLYQAINGGFVGVFTAAMNSALHKFDPSRQRQILDQDLYLFSFCICE